jgi:hypothetical protein
MRKIALEERFTCPDLSSYAYGPGSSMDREGFGRFEKRLLEFDGMRLHEPPVDAWSRTSVPPRKTLWEHGDSPGSRIICRGKTPIAVERLVESVPISDYRLIHSTRG